jgi:Serine/threonine protein kinase
MADALLEEFLAGFDGEHYPADFQRDYEALECLAHNEQGETLLVKDRKTGSLCVAKCYSDAQPAARAGESSLLQGFHHSGLPSFINEYQDESTLCVVRGFVEGTPLDQLAAAAPLEPRRAVGIILQLCDILNYLHNQKPPVIHRDLKPQNVIVDERGHVTLIDFASRAFTTKPPVTTRCASARATTAR